MLFTPSTPHAAWIDPTTGRMWRAAVTGAAAAFDRELYAIDHCLALRDAAYSMTVAVETPDVWAFASARGAPSDVLFAIDRSGRHVLMSAPPPPAATRLTAGCGPRSRVCVAIASQVIRSYLTLAKTGWYNTALEPGAIGCAAGGSVVITGCHGLVHEDTDTGARRAALDAMTTTIWRVISNERRPPPEAAANLCSALDNRGTAWLLYALQPQSMSVITDPLTVTPSRTSVKGVASGGPPPANAKQPRHPGALLPTTNVVGDASEPARVEIAVARYSVAYTPDDSQPASSALSPTGSPGSAGSSSVKSVTSTTLGRLPSIHTNIVVSSSPTIGPGPTAHT